jgi:hypothetical protein
MDTEYGKMLIENNVLYKYPLPLSSLPANARDVKVSWELSNCFYVVDFAASDEPLHIDIDRPHIGMRGGSIRTRYFGKLEGIDPELRDHIYAEAKRKGISRVDYIESLLKNGMSKITRNKSPCVTILTTISPLPGKNRAVFLLPMAVSLPMDHIHAPFITKMTLL